MRYTPPRLNGCFHLNARRRRGLFWEEGRLEGARQVTPDTAEARRGEPERMKLRLNECCGGAGRLREQRTLARSTVTTTCPTQPCLAPLSPSLAPRPPHSAPASVSQKARR